MATSFVYQDNNDESDDNDNENDDNEKEYDDNDDNEDEDDDNDDADETWKEVSMATAVIWSSRSLKAQDRVAPTP